MGGGPLYATLLYSTLLCYSRCCSTLLCSTLLHLSPSTLFYSNRYSYKSSSRRGDWLNHHYFCSSSIGPGVANPTLFDVESNPFNLILEQAGTHTTPFYFTLPYNAPLWTSPLPCDCPHPVFVYAKRSFPVGGRSHIYIYIYIYDYVGARI